MEGEEPKVKRRVLPQWMREENANRNKTHSAVNLKRKKEFSPRKRTVYCMNEKELVEYALEVLNKDNRQMGNDVEISPETSTDVEAKAEARTSPARPACVPEITPSPSKALQNNADVLGTHSDSDEDPLKFVREIFFS
ncbi:cell cycle regulator of non-homologous end joining isoform 2-T2 [Rhinophrynus dorsalis]